MERNDDRLALAVLDVLRCSPLYGRECIEAIRTGSGQMHRSIVRLLNGCADGEQIEWEAGSSDLLPWIPYANVRVSDQLRRIVDREEFEEQPWQTMESDVDRENYGNYDAPASITDASEPPDAVEEDVGRITWPSEAA